MYRALPASRQAAGRGLVRVARRRLETAAVPPKPPPAAPVPKKKKGILRRVVFWTTLSTGTFYVASPFVAFQSPRYYDFFAESVPLGQGVLEFAEAHNWDTLTVAKVAELGKDAVKYVQRVASNQPSIPEAYDKAKAKADESTKDARHAASDAFHDSKDRLLTAASSLVTKVEKGSENVKEQGKTAAAVSRHQLAQWGDEIDRLVAEAEAALSDAPADGLPGITTTPEQPAGAPPEPTPLPSSAPRESGMNVYDGYLPVGFEPPPGYSRPAAPTPSKPHAPVKAEDQQPPLPLLAPTVAELGSTEPIISQLASTIDNLASYLNANPAAAAKAKDVLDTAKVDLTSLSDRISKVRDEERTQLERTLDEQTREYTVKLLELEMEAQDKLDSQEDGFRKFYDEEKVKFAKAYREKLEHELKTQTELINERLKEEVVAQGIEMQRRWIREIKVRVEQERGGRLAKLDELAANLKRLERVALDNSLYLDENLRVHALWSALRTVSSALDAPLRTPFREELRVLRHVTAAREDPVVSTALDALDATDIPDVGVEPLPDLASWFSTSVAPRVSSVALVPDENAGVLSHLASHLLSSFRFKRRGLVAGDDALSVLARAEYYLNEKDLDSAARELNQLNGTAKVLLHDWLAAARRRLEVQQALEVVQTQATLSSLLMV